MKINLASWTLMAAVVVLGLYVPATAEELLSGDKIGDRPVVKQKVPDEAHGLLAKKPVQLAAEMPVDKTDHEPDEALKAFPPARSAVRPASWTSFEANRANHTDLLSGGPEQAPTLSGSCACESDLACDCCVDPLWRHRCGVFADLLYLRPGNVDVIYAVEQTGTLPTDSQTGPTGRLGYDAALGYRFGANWALSDCSSLQASYTWFQDDTQNSITANPGNVLVFQQGLPSIPNVGASSVTASANMDIRFQQLDFDYRGLLYGTYDSAVNYFAGLRYANLKQNFHAQEDVGAPIGLTDAITHISFDGFGIGAGLDGMRRAPSCGLLVYGRASASFVSGEFKATYRQFAQFGPNSVVGNNLTDFRVLSILQSELGLGWQSACGRVRVTAGYQFAGWFNTLTTGSYILGVQNRQFNDLHETLTFDGLVTRVLWQF